MIDPNYDFSGYATKAELKCADGRTIKRDAFKHQDGISVPLVWQHFHNDPGNVLGHGILENREDGVYIYGYFNKSEAGLNAKELVIHKDVKSLSIYANDLLEKSKSVLHGNIREVSLVLSGANPGAHIDYIAVEHSDGAVENSEDEALIAFNILLDEKEVKHSDDEESDQTVEEVIESLSPVQKEVVFALIGMANEENEEVEHSASDEGENEVMKSNVFDKSTAPQVSGPILTHEQFKAIADKAQNMGGSLKQAFIAHAGTYGIDNISVLFPDAQTVTPTPDLVKRDTEWVSMFLNGARHTPFSRIKSSSADLTPDAARAKGYVTAALKTEEVFALLSRTTYPTTVYKKQKLDRDDIVDITDLDVVAFIKAEMRMMLDEEIARAGLVGDGRAPGADKIDEACIRPIYKDSDFYAHRVVLEADTDTDDMIENIIRARKFYKRSGNPVMFTTTDILTDMLLLKDTTGHRLYANISELAAELRVSSIVEVEVLENVSRVDPPFTMDLKAILVNPRDYTYGADKGGQIALFDDFDIDYNQYKYLMETRLSACLVHPKSALVIEKKRP